MKDSQDEADELQEKYSSDKFKIYWSSAFFYGDYVCNVTIRF